MLTDIDRAELCAAIYQDPSPVTWDKEYESPLGHAALKRIDGINRIVRRGSKDPIDWYRDFIALPREFPPLGWVHPGILAGVLWTFKEMEADLGSDPYELLGHSLGGGEIIGQAGLMIARGHPPQLVVAFEPPRVAFRSLCDHTRTRTYRNLDDPVTEVPDLEIPFEGRYVPEMAFIGLAGKPSVYDTSPLRAHHIGCVIAGLRALTPVA
jgi:hypothetical protein